MQHIQTSSFSSKLNHMLMLLVFQSIPQPLWLIESNLMQASLLTPLSWILLLGHAKKERTWSSFLWAWRSEWCLFSVAVSTERLCHWRFKFSFAIHRLLRRLSIPYTRLPLENISSRQPCEISVRSVLRFYASCATICLNLTSSTREGRWTLLSICGALFPTPDAAASALRPGDEAVKWTWTMKMEI